MIHRAASLALALLLGPWLAGPSPATAAGEALGSAATEAAATEAAATVPPGFSDTLVTSVGAPTDLAFVPGTSTVLITTQPGLVRRYQPSPSGLVTVLDLTASVCSNSERGILGIVLDPGFTTNRRLYLFYTFRTFGSCATNSASGPVNRVSRFTAAPDLAIDPASELVLLDNIPSVAGNHNGGDLEIGADGLLYVSVGDGGCRIGDPTRCAGQNDNARKLSTPLGKILRIGLDGSIPAANPWSSAAGARRCGDPAGVPPGSGPCRETFAWGLRNPFRIAFRPGTSEFHINDVGQGRWEEIDAGLAGADYGWNVREGHCANGSTTDCGPPPAGMTNPIFDYGRSAGCASITGGVFVPTGAWPAEYDGDYLFADYVCGRIFRLQPGPGGTWTSIEFATGLGSSSAVTLAFGPSAAGQSLYYTTYAGGGSVRRIDGPVANRAPTAALAATPLTGAAPLAVSFDASASADPDGDPLAYAVAFGDGDVLETGSPTFGHTFLTAGEYTVSLSVSDGRGGVSAPTSLTIEVTGNAAPEPTIGSPAEAATFAVGEVVTLAGSASDAEDGALPPSSLSWTVVLHHGSHTHPFLGPIGGTGITFAAPPPEDLAATLTSHLEIRLTATDSAGARTTVVRDLAPRVVAVTLATSPPGRTLRLNGGSIVGPTTLASWEGYALNVAAEMQLAGGRTYALHHWTDGGAATHTITTPAEPATYVAVYKSIRAFPIPGLLGSDRSAANSAVAPAGPVVAGRGADVGSVAELPIGADARDSDGADSWRSLDRLPTWFVARCLTPG
jgi:glucose/arabinose dehydrogenase/chitodextrinase